MENLALARQEVIFDVEPVHSLEVAAKNGGRNQIGKGGSFIAAFFDGMQCLQARTAGSALSCSYHCETRA